MQGFLKHTLPYLIQFPLPKNWFCEKSKSVRDPFYPLAISHQGIGYRAELGLRREVMVVDLQQHGSCLSYVIYSFDSRMFEGKEGAT